VICTVIMGRSLASGATDVIVRPEGRELELQVERATARVKNITAAMAAAGFSEALLAQLREEETALAALKARLASAKAYTRPKILPHTRVYD